MSGFFNDLWDLVFKDKKDGVDNINPHAYKKGGSMKPETINLITDILGLLIAIAEPVRSYLMSQPFSWPAFIFCIMTAIVAWFTGKGTIALKRDMIRRGVMKGDAPTAEDLH